MREFFIGWRRKAGCVLLLIAAASCAGWVRSFAVHDVVAIPVSNSYNYLVSASGEFALERTYPVPAGADFFWIPTPYDSDRAVFDFLQDNIEWKWRYAGLAVSSTSPGHTVDYVIHYAMLTIPAALLSAYLILWPGKRKSVNVCAEPGN